MKRKCWTLTFGLLLGLGSSRGFAVGLSNVDVQSSLNAPLKAYIDIVDLGGVDPRAMRARIIPNDVYAGSLSELHAGVVTPADAGPRVHLHSFVPIREPLMSFTLELTYPGGQVTREYNVLLDPPSFTLKRWLVRDAQIAQATVPPLRASAAASPPRERSVAAPAPAPARKFTPADLAGAQTYGPTRPNDTLWRIATRVRPGASIDMQAFMASIVEANPDAFIGGDMNKLRVDHVLRIPGGPATAAAPAETPSTPPVTAETSEPIAATAPAPAALPPVAEPASETTTVEASIEALFAPPAASATAESSPAVSETAARVADARNATEQLAQDNNELRARIAALEDQIKDLRAAMEAGDARVAAIKSQAGIAANSAATLPAVEVENTEASIAAAAPALQADQAASGTSSTSEGSATTSAASAAKDTASAAQPTTAPPTLETFVDHVRGLALVPVLMAVMAILLIVLIARELRRGLAKRRAGREHELRRRTDLVKTAAVREKTSAGRFERPAIGSPQPWHERTVEATLVPPAPGSFSDEPLGASTQDLRESLLKEIDLHIAYGEFELAEQWLRKALEAEPNKAPIKVKLAEVHYHARDRRAFLALAQNLAETGIQPELWERIAVMGAELFPDNTLFSTVPSGTADDDDRFVGRSNVIDFVPKRAASER